LLLAEINTPQELVQEVEATTLAVNMENVFYYKLGVIYVFSFVLAFSLMYLCCKYGLTNDPVNLVIIEGIQAP